MNATLPVGLLIIINSFFLSFMHLEHLLIQSNFSSKQQFRNVYILVCVQGINQADTHTHTHTHKHTHTHTPTRPTQQKHTHTHTHTHTPTHTHTHTHSHTDTHTHTHTFLPPGTFAHSAT